MPNPNYQAGRRFEYLRKRTWENRGFIVLRTAGSHGAYDLIAIAKDGTPPIYLIQCKRTRSKSEAKRLMNSFKAHPPLPVKELYCQVMEVGIAGEREIQEVIA